MLVIPLGMTMLSKLPQSSNAPSPIVSTLSGRLIFKRLSQFSKAYEPIYDTL